MEKITLEDVQRSLNSNTNINNLFKTALYECAFTLSDNNYDLIDFNNLCKNAKIIKKNLDLKPFSLEGNILYIDGNNINNCQDITRELFIEVGLPKIDSHYNSTVIGYKEIVANNLLGNISDNQENIEEFILTDALIKIIGLAPFEEMLKVKNIDPIVIKMTEMGMDTKRIFRILNNAEIVSKNKTVSSSNLAKASEELIDAFKDFRPNATQQDIILFEASIPTNNILFGKQRGSHLGLDDIHIPVFQNHKKSQVA